MNELARLAGIVKFAARHARAGGLLTSESAEQHQRGLPGFLRRSSLFP
jgi:hypothetical protein